MLRRTLGGHLSNLLASVFDLRWKGLTNSGRLESEVGLEILSDFTDKALEWKLSDQEFGTLLVSSDFSQGDGSWLVSVGLLDTSCGWGRLASGFL